MAELRLSMRIGGAIEQSFRSSIAFVRAQITQLGSTTRASFGGANQQIGQLHQSAVASSANAQIPAVSPASANQQQISQLQQNNQQRRENFRNRIGSTVASVGIIAFPLREAIRFESAMGDVKKNLTDIDAVGLKSVTKSIELIAKDSPLGSAGIATLVSEAGKIGLGTRAALEFARTSEKIGVAFELSAGRAGAVIAKLNASVGLSIPEIAKLGDVMNYTSDNMGTTAANVVGIVARFGSVAVTAGLTTNEMVGLAAAIDSVSPSSDSAGTAFKTLLTSLSAGASASGPVKKALSDIGFEASDLAVRMQRDAKGTILEVFEALKAAPESSQVGLLKTIFGQESIGAAGALLNNIGNYTKAMRLAHDETAYANSVNEEYANKAATTAHQIGVLKSQVGILAVHIGRVLLPPLKVVVGILGKVASAVADAAEEYPTLTKVVVGAAAGLAVLKIGMLGAGLGMTVITDAWIVGLRAINFFRASVILTNAQLVITRTRALAAAFATRVLGTAFVTAMGVGSVVSKVVTAFKAVGAVMLSLGGTIIPVVVAGFTALKVVVLANPIVAVVAAIAVGATLLVTNWGAVGDFFAGVWGGIKQGAQWAWDKIKVVASWSPLGIITANWGAITGFVGGIFDGVKLVVTATWATIKSLFGWSPTESIAAAWDPVTDYFSDLWSGIVDSAKVALDWVVAKFEAVTGWIGSAWNSIFGDDEDDEEEKKGEKTNRIGQKVVIGGISYSVGDQEQIAKNVGETQGGFRVAEPQRYRFGETEQRAVAANISNSQTITESVSAPITIYAAPNQEPVEIAKQVKIELEKVKAQERSARRGELFDGTSFGHQAASGL